MYIFFDSDDILKFDAIDNMIKAIYMNNFGYKADIFSFGADAVKEGKIYKTSSRPVKFFINSPKIKKHIKSALDKLSQNNISMNSAIEQAKASILYPPKGINCLILGETGVD